MRAFSWRKEEILERLSGMKSVVVVRRQRLGTLARRSLPSDRHPPSHARTPSHPSASSHGFQLKGYQQQRAGVAVVRARGRELERSRHHPVSATALHLRTIHVCMHDNQSQAVSLVAEILRAGLACLVDARSRQRRWSAGPLTTVDVLPASRGFSILSGAGRFRRGAARARLRLRR